MHSYNLVAFLPLKHLRPTVLFCAMVTFAKLLHRGLHPPRATCSMLLHHPAACSHAHLHAQTCYVLRVRLCHYQVLWFRHVSLAVRKQRGDSRHTPCYYVELATHTPDQTQAWTIFFAPVQTTLPGLNICVSQCRRRMG